MHLLLSSVYLFSTWFIPGVAFLLSLHGVPYRLPIFVVASFGISLAYSQIVTILLLHAGIFNLWALWVFIGIPPALALWRWKCVFVNMRAILPSLTELVASVSAGVVVILLLMASPPWNYLISFGMDAGNYENYSNYFWRHGALYFDASEYVRLGIPLEWYCYVNNWDFSGSPALGRPFYLYGFPALLGIAKAIFGSPSVSWVVNGLLAVFSGATLALIAARLTRKAVIGALIGIGLCLTPVFFYYSKQIMSEQVSLFGFLLLLLGLVEGNRRRDLGSLTILLSGMSLLCLSSLNVFVIPAFLFVAASLPYLEALERKLRSPLPTLYLIAFGTTTMVCAAIVVWLCSPSYLNLFSFPIYRKITNVPFLLTYGIIMFCAFGILAILQSARAKYQALVQPIVSRLKPSNMITMAMAAGWVVFVAWNVSIRPLGADSIHQHDSFNLIRLFGVTSPLLLGVFLAAVPVTLLVTRGTRRLIIVMGILLVSLMIFKSYHSRFEIWWMRRYLTGLLPTMAVVLGVFVRFLMAHLKAPRFNTRLAIIIFLAITLGSQWIPLKPLLAHKVHEMAPSRLAELADSMPYNTAVINIKGDRFITGMTNTFRTLHSGLVLTDVSQDVLSEAMGKFSSSVPIAVISPTRLPDNVIQELRLSYKGNGIFPFQGSSFIASIRKNPEAEHISKYFLYIREN